ncbi:MAG: alpha/beta family hydrolase [Gemmatimonadota bacterium]
MSTKEIEIPVGKTVGSVSGILDRPAGARAILALAHGAGAGMRHPFMESIAARLAERGVATLRYHFPYMEHGVRRPDPPGILLATVRVAAARAQEEGLPLFAGGKSLGGRMTSTAASTAASTSSAAKASRAATASSAGRASRAESTGSLPDVKGIVFFGFPLHAPGRPSSDRAEHLERVAVPMLFLQGTRDALADLDLLRPVVERLGKRASLHVIEGADHSFRVPKRAGRSDAEVLDELAEVAAAWIDRVVGTARQRR